MKRIPMVIIAILLGVVAPACTIAGPSPRHGPPQGPQPDHGDDRGYDEYRRPRADVGFFYDELSPAAGSEQKDTKEKDKSQEAPKGRLEMRGETLEWMDLRHPGRGFELPGPEKVWHICELRPSESFCHQLDLELLAVYWNRPTRWSL